MQTNNKFRTAIMRSPETSERGYSTPPAPPRKNMADAPALNARNRALTTMLAVTICHLAILYWVFHHPVPIQPPQPALSFTVTMMEMSSSAASTVSTPPEKSEPEKIVTEIKPVKQPVKLKKPVKAVKAEANPAPQSLAPMPHSPQAQTAVLAPITPARFAAAYLKNPPPVYPSISRRLGEQGSILLSVYVNEQGTAETAVVSKSSGVERLDSAALAAVKRWRFIPARREDQLLASWVQVPIKFILE